MVWEDVRNIEKPYVLLVEDNSLVEKVHTRMLEQLGCVIDFARNGQQAINKAINHYDMIFMDMNLPDINGDEVTRQICSINQNNKFVPIVMLSSEQGVGIKIRCLAAGAKLFLQKPVSKETLTEILQQYGLYVRA